MEKRDFSKSGPRINRKANAGKNTSNTHQRYFYKNADNLFFSQKPASKVKTGAIIAGGLVVLGGILWALKDKFSSAETNKE